MNAALGAVTGAAAVVAMLVSYNTGARQGMMAAATPAVQMVVGPEGVARPYLVQAGQMAGQQGALPQPYGWPAYGTMAPGAIATGYAAYPAHAAYQPAGVRPVQTSYVTERAVPPPAARRVETPRESSEVRPERSWQKSALLIGGSAGAGAGALMGGKKGALAGAAIGGGAAAIYDQMKRH